jgi:antitoxin component of MazEF toxin-antitoxin module
MKRQAQCSIESTRTTYVTQPYNVGSKRGRSLALIIPAKIARQCKITTDTVFSVKADTRTRAITLQTMMTATEEDGVDDENNKTKAGAEGGATNNNLSAATL